MTDLHEGSRPSGGHTPQLVTRVLGRGKDVYAQARERARVLRELRSEALVVPHSIAVHDSGEVVAEMPAVNGHDIGAILRMRGRLHLSECVQLGIEVGRTLAAMHSAGVAHGDISAANVMVQDGRVVVVDCIAGALANEAGTVPYAAPERPQGATPAADVYALGRLLGESVRDSDRERIEPWLLPMMATDPEARPRAVMVERALSACAQPQAIDVPALSVASDMRTKAQGPAHRTTRLESGKPWRARRAVVQWGTVAVVAIIAAVVTWTVALPAVSQAVDPPRQPTFDPAMPIPAGAAVSPEEGARLVTHARFDALAAGDAEALLATTGDGSPAREQVAEQARALEGGDIAFHGLDVDLVNVEVLSQSGRRASVGVQYVVAPHQVVAGETSTAFEGYEQAVELDLAWSEQGWQVLRVRPGQ